MTVAGTRGEDTEICDFAVALGCGTIRECGLSFTGNRLMKIREELGAQAVFLGAAGLSGKRFRENKERQTTDHEN